MLISEYMRICSHLSNNTPLLSQGIDHRPTTHVPAPVFYTHLTQVNLDTRDDFLPQSSYLRVVPVSAPISKLQTEKLENLQQPADFVEYLRRSFDMFHVAYSHILQRRRISSRLPQQPHLHRFQHGKPVRKIPILSQRRQPPVLHAPNRKQIARAWRGPGHLVRNRTRHWCVHLRRCDPRPEIGHLTDHEPVGYLDLGLHHLHGGTHLFEALHEIVLLGVHLTK
mmetsp:Transcript_14922/g.32171  ORF Transcript_14922/g.32171 Transcript_14922/m.32171 type:complete len:224 (-) Transcript_14922:393-1064(-)